MNKKLTAVLAALLALSGCGKSVEISGDRLRLSLGQEQTLKVKGEDLEFSSMDPNIAAVDENGVVTGLGNGVTVITAKNGKGYDNIGVVVGNGAALYVDEYGETTPSLSAQPVDEAVISGQSSITAVTISLVGGGSEDVTINTERTYEIKITRTPADSPDKITLRTADPTVAKVEGRILRGLSRGKTVLTATAPNGVSAEMIVRVK